MRDAPREDEAPEPMRGAWHLDVHRGPMPDLLDPPDLVAAVFRIPRRELALGDEVGTAFGKFHVDDLVREESRRAVLLRTAAPGSTSRFAIAVRRRADGACEAVLHNSVHPTSWLGRLYFRAIEVGHHGVMEIALRRLARAARARAEG